MSVQCEHRNAIYFFQVAPCSPLWYHSLWNKTNLLLTHAQISSRLWGWGTLHTESRTYVEWFSLWQNSTCNTHAFQHCQRYALCFHEVFYMQVAPLVPFQCKSEMCVLQNCPQPQVGPTNQYHLLFSNYISRL